MATAADCGAVSNYLEWGVTTSFCGGLLANKEPGLYACVCCDLPLFESSAKFESGTGWPSFFQPVAGENLREEPDHSLGREAAQCSARPAGFAVSCGITGPASGTVTTSGRQAASRARCVECVTSSTGAICGV